MGWRSAVALGALAIGLATPVASAEQVPAARERVILSGAGTVVSAMHLSKPSVLRSPFKTSPDFSVSGGGAISVLRLVHRGSGETLTAVQVRTQSGTDSYVIPTGSMNSPTPTGHYELYKTYTDDVSLRSGTWDLTMFSEGRASATLRLRGLPKGSTDLRARSRSAATVAVPAKQTPPESVSSSPNVHGSQERLPKGASLYVQVLVLDTTVWLAGQYTLCRRVISGNPAPLIDDPAICLNGQRTTFNERIQTMTPDAKVIVSVTRDAPVDAAFGLLAVGEGAIERSTYTTISF